MKRREGLITAKVASQGRDRQGKPLSSTATPEALARKQAQPERGYNRVGCFGVPKSSPLIQPERRLRSASGARQLPEGLLKSTAAPQAPAEAPGQLERGDNKPGAVGFPPLRA